MPADAIVHVAHDAAALFEQHGGALVAADFLHDCRKISRSRSVTSTLSFSAVAVAASKMPRARKASESKSASGKNVTAAPSEDAVGLQETYGMMMSAMAAMNNKDEG